MKKSIELLVDKKFLDRPAGLEEARQCDLILFNTPYKNYSGDFRGFVPNAPLGEGYILSYVAQFGYNCGMIDAECAGIPIQRVKEMVERVQPRYLGFNLFSPMSEFSFEVMARIGYPRMIVGGPHATVMPDHVLEKDKRIIAVVRGEGEETTREILTGKPLEEIKGVSFRNNGQVVHNPDREYFEDLDVLPLINRDYFQADPYRQGNYVVANVTTSRGCPFSCTFCAAPSLTSRRIRFHSVERVVEEIKALHTGPYKVNYLRFNDDFFLHTENRAREYFTALEREGLMGRFRWDALTRVDTVLQYSNETMSRIKDSGVEFLSLGIETGNNERLRTTKKNVTTKQIEAAVDRCHSFGIELKGFFLFGFPEETEEEMRQTIDFACRLREKGMRRATFNELRPYPGTELFNQLLTQGWSMEELMTYQYADLVHEDDNARTVKYLRERAKYSTGLARSISAVEAITARSILREAMLEFNISGIAFFDEYLR